MILTPLELVLLLLIIVLCPIATFVGIALAFWIWIKAQRENAQTISFLTQTRSMLVKVDYDTREVMADPVYTKRREVQQKRGPQIPDERDLRAAVLAGRDQDVLLEDPDMHDEDDLSAPPPSSGQSVEYVDEHAPIPPGGLYHSAGE
jgi:hypothetical protein